MTVDWFEGMGLGLRAGREILTGQVVGVFTGCLVRKSDRTPSICPSYIRSFNNEYVVDATEAGSLMRYVNSSCNPNVTLERWRADELEHLVYVAIRNIQTGEPLNAEWGDPSWKGPCRCGEHMCKGRMVRHALGRKPGFRLPPHPRE